MHWVRVAGVLALQAAACRASGGDDLTACNAAQVQLTKDRSKAHAVMAICDRAYRRTGNPEAVGGRVYAQLIDGDLDAVIAAAREMHDPGGARVWHMAGDAELERGHRTEARAWYERALEANRTQNPKRAGNSASRIADIAEAENHLDDAIHFRYVAVTLADAAGDVEARLIMTLGLAELLLNVGDTRTAKRALATVANTVPDDSPFQQDYLRVAGEADAQAGRANAAAASFQRCTQAPAPIANPYVQLRCRVGLAALVANGLRPGTGDDALATIEQAATFLDGADQLMGFDADRRAELAWLRATVHLRAGHVDRAVELLDAIERKDLGAAMLSRVDHARGVALAATGDRAGAEASFLAAAAAVEKLRDSAAHGATRRSLPRELRAPYEAIFALRAGSGDTRGAVEIMERALERDFVDQLAAGVVGGEDAASDAASLSKSVADAERRVRALALLDARPRMAFDAATADTQLTAIGFFAAEGTLWRVVIRRGTPQIARVAPLDEITPLVAAVAADPAAPEAATLEARLLPAELLPRRGDVLVVVPDPLLEGVRFAALPGDGGFLVERNPVVVAPTFAVGLAPPAAATTPAGPPIVLGDPDATLPSARAEATAVAGLLGVAPQLGPAANRAAIAAARRARVLHVASHGSVRDDGTIISLSDLALGPTEVLELGLAPDLAVIASCASAATRPDGMWTSITSALLASGARTIVGALGSIPDGASAAILTDFHREAATAGAVRALADAQRAAIARGVPVAVWSSFAVFGHDTTTTRRN